MTRIALRFLIPLALVLTALQYAMLPLTDRLMRAWSVRDLDIRVSLIANSIHDSLTETLLAPHVSATRINALLERVTKDERVYAVGFCNLGGQLVYRTSAFPDRVDCSEASEADEANRIFTMPGGPLHFGSATISEDGHPIGRLILIHDMSFVERRTASARRYIFYFFLVLGLLISITTLSIAYISWRGWVAGIRAMLRGERLPSPTQLREADPEVRPVLREIRSLMKDISRRELEGSRGIWSPDTLKEILREKMPGDEILIVSNREPYLHVRTKDGIVVQNPASGLVTALEPVMRACSGTWIAHGSGNADREVVDANDRISVPPESPSYNLRRVWLTPEEEDGYYYGFANEGLWPLCHIAHVRPIFRSQDWKHYVEVNRKFADAVVKEAATSHPIVLIQDYHFALLPKLVREKLPDATIISFWHIPWPNPESFGICPWREQILEGLLGSSIIGFHTRFHCNNFLETVDRFLECRIDRETNTISQAGRLTAIRHYPISIEWPTRWMATQKPVPECRKLLRERLGLRPDVKVGIGVDRLDYTKGLLERFLSIQRFFELYPKWRGKFSFVQIAAPSRSKINQYQNFDREMTDLAERINAEFGRNDWKPIYLMKEHHEPHSVFEHFRGADFCFVSSLHDGMNLVAKEFLASRDDEQGSLLLSLFAGASRELSEALIVNPYNFDQCASAILAALEMPEAEQRERMRALRSAVAENNVYRWAGRMLLDAALLRQRDRLLRRTSDWDPKEGESPFL